MQLLAFEPIVGEITLDKTLLINEYRREILLFYGYPGKLPQYRVGSST